MRKRLLSSIIAIILVLTNPEVASSVEEIKNTDISTTSITSVTQIEEVNNYSAPQTITLEEKPKDEYLLFNITAYTSGYESTQKKKGHPLYGVTASGDMVKEGVTIACPKSFEFGTKIYIADLDHTYTCQDRGSRITEGHIDIYFDNLSEAKKFGRKDMKVKIVE